MIQPQPLVLLQVLSDIVRADDVALNVYPGLAVMADPLVIDRVVTNLVANARNYGTPPIRIDAEEVDSYVRISVSDDGVGVPEELVPRLFERFERGEDGVGSGLGLAIARHTPPRTAATCSTTRASPAPVSSSSSRDRKKPVNTPRRPHGSMFLGYPMDI